jgi:hypothetical protein
MVIVETEEDEGSNPSHGLILGSSEAEQLPVKEKRAGSNPAPGVARKLKICAG